jgi:hypothetical protein
MGAKRPDIVSFLGPENIAEGIISPKKRTSVTLRNIAT